MPLPPDRTTPSGGVNDLPQDPREVHRLGDERRHYWLALEMSRIAGLDLQAELDAGRISHEDWAGVVTRCRGCGWAGDCPAWMNIVHDAAPEHPEAIPDLCDNAAVFAKLHAGSGEAGSRE